MKRRIVLAILAVTAGAVALFGIPLAILVERSVDDNATIRLERQAILAARDVPADFPASATPVPIAPGIDGAHLALYDTTGHRVAGTGPDQADATTTAALHDRVTDVEHRGTRVVAVPVAADQTVVGAIRAEQSTAASQRRSWRIAGLLGALAAAVLSVGAGVALVVAERLARPVRRLSQAAVDLGDGDFTVTIRPSGVAELDQASEALTVTARRLDDLLRRERAFSADASHQLRTPLAGLRAAIETELAFPRPDATEVLHEALSDIDRLERTITELLALARRPTEPGSSTELGPVLALVGDTWRAPLAAAGRRLDIADASALAPVTGNGTLLRHALDVLVDNALLHGQGAVRIDHHDGGDSITLSVSDEGAGFPTPLPADGATQGMGLPLARRLVEAMPGRLVIARPGPCPRIDVVLTRSRPVG